MLQPSLMALVVNGEAVDDAEIREEARSLRPRYMEMMQGGDPIALEMQLREWSRENVIERVLLRQEAARQAATLEALVDKVTAKIPPPKYKDVGEFYRKNKENFWVPELIHAAHIVKNVDENTTEEEALEAIRAAEEELKGGAAFGEVADRASDCPGNGGDLGWFPPGQMVPEFDEVVFKLETGATSEIFRTMFGFHIAHLMERKAAGIPGLMDVRGHIEGMMLKEKRQKALDQFVDELKARATIHG